MEADDATHIRHVYDTDKKTVGKKSVMESLFTRIINDIEKISLGLRDRCTQYSEQEGIKLFAFPSSYCYSLFISILCIENCDQSARWGVQEHQS